MNQNFIVKDTRVHGKVDTLLPLSTHQPYAIPILVSTLAVISVLFFSRSRIFG